MESQLIDAIIESKIDVVRSLLEKGVNVNYVPMVGKSPLSTAAALGNISIMKLLLNAHKTNHLISPEDVIVNQQGAESLSVDDFSSNKTNKKNCNSNHTSFEYKKNQGYYVFVHNEDPSSNGVSRVVNQNESLDIESPEDMDDLEWFLEVEGVDDPVSDDVWSLQYRWYANILDKTGGLLHEEVRGCDPNLSDSSGYCAVHYAVESSQLEALQCLISAGCKVNVSDMEQLSPLHVAAMRDRVEEARVLIQAGAKVNNKSSDKMAPLHFAAARGFTEMVTLLIKGGATLDILDASDRTPLYLAVTRGHFDVVEILLDCGAKVNIEEIHGYTPLCEAVWSKSVDTANLLLRKGAKLTQSHYLLHYAVLHRHLPMVELLLKNGAYPNLREDHGDTPLLLAINCQDLVMVQLLLRYGANPNYSSSVSNMTPLHKAIRVSGPFKNSFFEEVLKLLCLYNVDLNEPTGSRFKTPLMIAFYTDLNCAASLIRAGADVNLHTDPPPEIRAHLTEHDESHLSVALSSKAYDLVYLLVAAGYNLTSHRIDFPKAWSNVNTETVHGWLTYMKFNPQRLTDLCRIEMRRQMGNAALNLIPRLEIPISLKEFLLFQDIYVKKYNYRQE